MKDYSNKHFYSVMLLLIVLALSVAACGGNSELSSTTPISQANSQSTQISTATNSPTFTPSHTPTATQTSTPTLTPTSTSTPTITPIPDQLGNIPESFDAKDISISATNYQYQVTDISWYERLGDKNAKDGYHYIVLLGNFFNYSNESIVLHDADFKADFAEQNNVLPDTNLMHDAQQNLFYNYSYPDRNIIGYPTFEIAAKRYSPMLLVYEVPEDTEIIRINFAPKGISPASVLGIGFMPYGETNNYFIYKESVQGELQYDITLNTQDSNFEELIRTDIVTVDNCYGTAEIEREPSIKVVEEFAFSSGGSNETHFEASLNGPLKVLGVSVLDSLPISASLEHTTRNEYNEETREAQEVTFTERVSAAPGTRPQWEWRVYMVSYKGVAIVTLGTEIFEVPYTLNRQLKVDLISIPSEPCPTLSPSQTAAP